MKITVIYPYWQIISDSVFQKIWDRFLEIRNQKQRGEEAISKQ